MMATVKREKGRLMAARTYNTEYQSMGTSALAPKSYPYLQLLEGGKSYAPVEGAGAASSARQAAPVRSKLFGLLVIASFVSILTITLFISELATQSRRSMALSSVTYEDVVVEGGDTLWSIAKNHGVSGASTREVVNLIEEHNDLDGGAIRAGQHLAVPAQGR